MVTISKETDYITDVLFRFGACVISVSVGRFSPVDSVLLRRKIASFSGASWEKRKDKRREHCFKSVNWNIFASQRAHFPLTVRRCSSVEEQLTWLDSNGKHTVRLVTNQKCVQDCMGTRVCMTNYWACFSKFLCWSSTLVMVRSNCYHICEIYSVIGVEYCLISQVKCAIYHNDTIQGCCN